MHLDYEQVVEQHRATMRLIRAKEWLVYCACLALMIASTAALIAAI